MLESYILPLPMFIKICSVLKFVSDLGSYGSSLNQIISTGHTDFTKKALSEPEHF